MVELVLSYDEYKDIMYCQEPMKSAGSQYGLYTLYNGLVLYYCVQSVSH